MKVSLTIIVLLVASFSCTVTALKFKQGCHTPLKDYTDCMETANSKKPNDATNQCKTNLKNTLKTCFDKDVGKAELNAKVKDAVRKALFECQMDSTKTKENCDNLSKILRASDKGQTAEERREQKIKEEKDAGKIWLKNVNVYESCQH